MRRWWWALLPVLIMFLWAARVQRVRAQETAGPARIQDVIYRRKHGVALTLDVFKPAKPSGIGVLWMVSGGWVSSHDNINPAGLKPFLDRGQTVFAVVHGSQPKYTIPEILVDIQRATRFVRYHAAEYGVDPNRLGISGGSAGGHLSLMEGVLGADGDPKAKDPVDQVNSRVQAVACFFPPTDFLNYGKPGENAVGRGTLKAFYPPFAFHTEDPTGGFTPRYVPVTDEAKIQEIAREISPAYHVTADDPPTLIIHGDADTLVPIQQSELMMQKFEEVKVPHELIVRKGAGHGGAAFGQDVSLLAEWFDKYLAKK